MRAALVSLRPRQWSKNLLLFAGIVFAAKLGDAGRWAQALAIFVAYCGARAPRISSTTSATPPTTGCIR